MNDNKVRVPVVKCPSATHGTIFYKIIFVVLKLFFKHENIFCNFCVNLFTNDNSVHLPDLECPSVKKCEAAYYFFPKYIHSPKIVFGNREQILS